MSAPDECKRSRGLPCNEEQSERSERDFTVEKDMGRSCVYYAKPIEVISFKPIKVGL